MVDPAPHSESLHASAGSEGAPPVRALRASVLALALAAACGGGEAPNSTDPANASGDAAHTASTPDAPAPPAKRAIPDRIVLTNASAVDIVFDLVGYEHVVAIPAGFDAYVNVGGLDAFGPEQRFGEFNAEVVLALDPDLVVAGSWTASESIGHLRDAGIDVYVMPTVDSLDDIRTSITEIGAKLDCADRAAALAASFDARIAELRHAAEQRDLARVDMLTGEALPRPGVVSYTNYGSGGWTAGTGTTADLVIELAGARNLAAEAGRDGHDLVDFETLFAWDPDWIVVSTPSDDYGQTRAFLENEPALAGLRAIQSKHIAEVDAALYSTTSHYLVDAAAELARILDPHGE